MLTKTIVIDSTEHRTELCDLAAKYKCDKGPFTEGSVNMNHRKGYTAVYNMLFSSLRNKPINFLELGLQNGDSIQLFTEYFSDMEYYGIDNNDGSIERCKNLNIPRTHYYKGQVGNHELEDMISSMNAQFDVILDDSSHMVEDQWNIIRVGAKYLKPGGILIIEDLERLWNENIYNEVQDVIDSEFSFSTFIVAHHNNRECWDNDKLWVGFKK